MRFPHRSAVFSRAMIGTVAALMFATNCFAVDIVDDAVQIDDRAAQVVLASNSLCWEMHRYHQKQPDFAATYRSAKDLWTQAGDIRDALRAGPVETDALKQRLNEMNAAFKQIESKLSKWGTGDLTQVANNSGPTQRTVVTQGTAVDLPLLGIHVGRPRVFVEEDDTPQLDRRRLHPNSPGSKRSLERELAATKVALSYLTEDANVAVPATAAEVNDPAPAATEPAATDADAAAATSPTPEPPAPAATTNDAQAIPAAAKKTDGQTAPK